MGVRGLQSFLKNNEDSLAQRTAISDTNLVIDANNLLCYLYAEICSNRQSSHFRNDVYGGDLVFYGQVVRELFANLQKCDIRPVLVFDGSVIGKHALKDFVASKERETLRRGLDRFNRAKVLDEFDSDTDSIMLPQTINTVFRNIAVEFGVRRIQTPYEADTHIARVANELDCPVLTNDSDFLIYSLKRGFIMLDMLDYKRPRVGKSGKSYINCSLYTQQRLAQRLGGFNVDNMPLLSVLLGNDYVEQGTFDRLLQSICNGPYHGAFECRSFAHRRIGNLLTWLCGQSLSRSIEYVLDLVHPSNRENLQKIITLLLRSYRIEQTDDFDAELEAIYPSSKAVKPATSVNEEKIEKPTTPVAFLRRQMERDDLGSMALDMIFRNTHYNYSILDDFTLPSSSYPKFRPYELALTLLRPHSYENLSTYKRAIQAERDAFLVYDRVRGDYTALKVRPMQHLEHFGPLDHITCYSMIVMEPSLKKDMLMDCFRFNQHEQVLLDDTVAQLFVDEYKSQATLCFLLVKYVGLETKLAPKPQFVNALVLTIFYYASLNGCLNKTTFNDKSAYMPLIEQFNPHTLMCNGKSYPAVNDKAIYRRIVHCISQLQAAYKAYCLVNSLLDNIFHRPKQEKFFNATLIYRLTKMFRFKEWKLDELCADLPDLADICDAIQVQVQCA